MSKRVLLLTHAFAPYSFPESYLSAKKIGNIKKYDVDVITMHAFNPSVKLDNDFFLYAKGKFKNITQLTAPSFYNRLPFSKFESFFSVPDNYLYLCFMYKKYLLDLEKYSAIITWSMFHSIHLLGCWVKKRNPHLPWIAHFSDPWVANPFISHKNFIVKKVNQIFEKKVFTETDLLLFTSSETVDRCLDPLHYPASFKEKSRVIPHAFDESLYFNHIPFLKEDPRKLKVSYIGTFYGERKPDSFLQALKLLKAQDPSLANKIEVCFIGSTKNQIKNDEENLVKVEESVGYIASLRKMIESDLLLVIDAPFENSPFLPSKLIDYIGANKPIFGITPPGTSQKLIEEMGFLVAHPNEPTDIANKFMLMIQMISEGKICGVPSHIRDRYSVTTVGDQMKDILDKVTCNASLDCPLLPI